MYATEILSSEHRVIEQVLNCVAALVEQSEFRGTFDWKSAEQMIDFLRNFADGCHHAKEEEQLFPALEARGFSPEVGPTSVMRSEHQAGRKHVAAMAAAVDAGLRGDNSRAGQHARYLLLANALADRFDVPRNMDSVTPATVCCGHHG